MAAGADHDLTRGLARTIIDASPAAILAVDPDGLICYTNPLVAPLFGYAEGELEGQPLEVLVPPARREAYRAHRAEFEAHPTPRPMGSVPGLTAVRKDGTVFRVSISLTPVQTDRGLQVLAAVNDMSARLRDEQRIRELGRAYLTLAQTNEAVVRASDVGSLYQDACDISVTQGGYLGAWVGVADDDGWVRVAATAGSLDEYIHALRITTDPRDPSGQGPTGTALREGRACYAADFLSDPRTAPWHEVGAGFGIRASATLPLRRQGRNVACLTLYSAMPDVFDGQMRGLLGQLAGNISYALDRFAADERLRRVAAQRSDLLDRLVAAQEHERNRIAADVHDDSVQTLAALDLRLGLLRRRIEASAPELAPDVATLQQMLSAATASLRDVLFALEAPPAEVPLVPAVREAAAHLLEGTAIRWDVASDGEPDLPATERGQALRVVKEAITNARKHSGAARLEVHVREVDDGVEVTVDDDGVGFDAGAPSAPGHRGLATMRDRAEASGGWCAVRARDGGGTSVRLWLPCDAPR